MLLLAVFIVPLLAAIAIGLEMRTPILPVMALLLLVGSGLLRIAYALLFQSADPRPIETQFAFPAVADPGRLPQAQSVPVADFTPPAQGSWRTTNDLVPHSVTDSTTKLLEKEESL